MEPRIKLIRNLEEAKEELKKIGVHPYSLKLMAPKALFYTIKLEQADSSIANILKQEMLSLGGDAALSKNAVFGRGKTGLLLMGTLKQYTLLIKKLKKQPFNLPSLAAKIHFLLFQKTPPMKIGPRTFQFGKRTYLMGVLNVTPDSFSDGGRYSSPEKAIARAKKMVSERADIIDIGAESSRPGAEPVSAKEEWRRLSSVLPELLKLKVPLSVDTCKPEVAEKCLKAGAHMINDITGLRSKKMAKVVAKYKCPIVLMHMLGSPRTMQENPEYKDVCGEIISFLRKRMEFAKKHGIQENKIIIDPGIGFGKTLAHNLELLRNLSEFKSLGRPILLGTSRKSFIGKLLNLPANERLEGTLASISIAIQNGADIVRVHDVKESKRAARVADAFRQN